MKSILKKLVPHLISILAFVIVSSVYFHPAWEGKSLQQDDIVTGSGLVSEKIRYEKYEDKEVLWNSIVFSGMPDFLNASYKGATKLWFLWGIPQRIGIPQEVSFLIWYMLGFYILLVALNINPWLAMAGAISFGLTSYNLIIIDAGHFMKVRTLALIPPVLGGVLLIFKRKYVIGFAITALFLALQITMAHVQMSYYFMFGLLIIGFTELWYHIKKKEVNHFSKAVAFLFLAAVLGIGPNYAKLYNFYKYNKQTIRGKSELTIGKDPTVKTEKGLDRDYINMWSSGKAESMMLFAPNAKGGGSAYVKQDRDLLRKVDSRYRETLGNMNQYWGDQVPVSGGPNTAGAVIFTLFVIGIFLIRGPLKIGILFSVIMYVMLSWGEHFSIFTNLFIDYVPLYNKFRTPVSILAVAVIFITFFAFFTIHKIIQKPNLLEKESKVNIGKKRMPTYLAAGFGFLVFILLNILFPNFLNDFMNETEVSMFDRARSQGNSGQIDILIASLEDLRISVFRTELIRTLFFATLVVLSFVLFHLKKIKANIFIVLISLLSILDVWTIAQRYVNNDDFSKRNIVKKEYQLTDIDKQIYAKELNENPILKTKLDDAYNAFKPKNEQEKGDIQSYIITKNSFYRVFNTTRSPFQENFTSNAHRSIGGYHAAKLRRYQDMIEHHIAKGNPQVLNMLNTKYIVGNNGLQVNSNIAGPVWFADSILWANNAEEEIPALNNFDINQAVINVKDKTLISEFNRAGNSDKIELISSDADYLKYRSTISSGNRLVIFSEVYYPDWTVLIDGVQADYFTANYILRAMIIPEGDHDIEFIFKPDYYYQSNTISNILYYILWATLLGAFFYEYFQRKKIRTTQTNKAA